MMRGWKGFAFGALALTTFELVVGGGVTSAKRVSGVFTGAANVVHKFIAPVPLFGTKTTASSTSSDGHVTAVPVAQTAPTPQQPYNPPNQYPTTSGEQGVLA